MDSDYVVGFKYVRVLNIQGLPILATWQFSEYALWKGSVLECCYERVQNITGFQTCQVSAYESVTQGSEYGWIMLE